jgi:hypothetical protein
MSQTPLETGTSLPEDSQSGSHPSLSEGQSINFFDLVHDRLSMLNECIQRTLHTTSEENSIKLRLAPLISRRLRAINQDINTQLITDPIKAFKYQARANFDLTEIIPDFENRKMAAVNATDFYINLLNFYGRFDLVANLEHPLDSNRLQLTLRTPPNFTRFTPAHPPSGTSFPIQEIARLDQENNQAQAILLPETPTLIRYYPSGMPPQQVQQLAIANGQDHVYATIIDVPAENYFQNSRVLFVQEGQLIILTASEYEAQLTSDFEIISQTLSHGDFIGLTDQSRFRVIGTRGKGAAYSRWGLVQEPFQSS